VKHHEAMAASETMVVLQQITAAAWATRRRADVLA
jgi:hypothetical protein